ncbi:hypothetical protein C8R43DRAFT_944815 [Mycena crocata]|nr:hypothetical protein C8R43DRAFT_944815 [Mycena crocata]
MKNSLHGTYGDGAAFRASDPSDPQIVPGRDLLGGDCCVVTGGGLLHLKEVEHSKCVFCIKTVKFITSWAMNWLQRAQLNGIFSVHRIVRPNPGAQGWEAEQPQSPRQPDTGRPSLTTLFRLDYDDPLTFGEHAVRDPELLSGCLNAMHMRINLICGRTSAHRVLRRTGATGATVRHAVILGVEPEQKNVFTGISGPYLFLHYKGCPKIYDEWVYAKKVLQYSTVNRALPRAPSFEPESGPPGQFVIRDSKVKHPLQLVQRVLYWEPYQIQKHKLVGPFPRNPTVSTLLKEFGSYLTTRQPHEVVDMHKFIPTVLELIRRNFQEALDWHLLYAPEIPQYDEFLKGSLVESKSEGTEIDLCAIYGAEHLLRWLVYGPNIDFRTYPNLPPMFEKIFRTYINAFLSFVLCSCSTPLRTDYFCFNLEIFSHLDLHGGIQVNGEHEERVGLDKAGSVGNRDG